MKRLVWMVVFIALHCTLEVSTAAYHCQYPCPPKRYGTLVNCFANPCEVEKPECPACPDATCRPNYCGGCNYFFKLRRKKICDCGEVKCKDSELVHCLVDPCFNVDTSDGVICLSNYCGGCNRVCYKNCRKLSYCPMLNVAIAE